MYSLKQLQSMDTDRISGLITETLKAEGDVYLDKLDSGQYMVSYAEFPEYVHTVLGQALTRFYRMSENQ